MVKKNEEKSQEIEQLKRQVGDRLRKLRQGKDLSQENMAYELGITPTAYGKIERGETDVSISRLYHICKILEIELADLLDFENNVHQNIYRDEPVLEPDIANKKLSNQSDLEVALERIVELKKHIQTQKELIALQKLRMDYLEDELNKYKGAKE